MASALDKIRASMANKAAAPAPAPEPEPEVLSPTSPETPVSETALTTAAEASTALAALFGNATPSVSYTDLVPSDGGGMSHSLPFCTLRKGSWTSKHDNPDIAEALPAGNRAFRAIYIADRLGAVAWAGDGDPAGAKNPPLWQAVCPNPRLMPEAETLAAQTLAVGQKIQFTKRIDRTKFDTVGRLSPEIQLLLWTPNTGFFIAVVSSYNSVIATDAFLKKVKSPPFMPLLIEVKEEVVDNPKATDPKARSWSTHYLEMSFSTDDKAKTIKNAYDALSPVEVWATVKKFMETSDFNGLTADQLAEKLMQYVPLGIRL